MKLALPLILLLLQSVKVNAQNLNYPELMVVPKATERLIIESQRSEQNAWTNHLPLHVASATTLLAGLLTQSDLDDDRDSQGVKPKIAIAVGAGWLVTSIILQSTYRPYLKAAYEIKRQPKDTLRGQLAAERLAEEHIDQAGGLAKKIKWISFATNFGASALTMDSAKKDSPAQMVSILGMVSSTLPILFPLSWEKVSADHHSYKKKVFGPVTFINGLLMDPTTHRPVTGVLLGAYFN